MFKNPNEQNIPATFSIFFFLTYNFFKFFAIHFPPELTLFRDSPVFVCTKNGNPFADIILVSGGLLCL